jgi:hypothetical protein
MLACNKSGGMMVVFKRLQSSCGEYVPTRLLDMTLVGLLLHHVIVVSLVPLALTYLPEYDSTESQGLSMLERVTTYRSILFPKYSGDHKSNHIVFPQRCIRGAGPIDSVMHREYFQHIEEVSSSALRVASRTIAITAYGMIGGYVLSMTLPLIPSPVTFELSNCENFDVYW